MSRIDTPRRTEVAENRIWFLSLLVLSPPINHPTTPASSQHYASLTIPQSDTQATQWSCPEWRAHSTPDELCSDRNWLRQIGSAAKRVWLGVEWSGENKQQRYVKIWAFRSSARLVINCRKGVGHKVLVLHFRYTVHFAAASPNLVLSHYFFCFDFIRPQKHPIPIHSSFRTLGWLAGSVVVSSFGDIERYT